jgi:hypothetical protein
MENDGFEFQSDTSVYGIQRTVMEPYDTTGDEPFGLEAQWDELGLVASVTLNVSHLSVLLPRNPGLALGAPAIIRFTFGAAETLRRQPPQGTTIFDVTITPTTVANVNKVAQGFQTVAALLGAVMLPLPIDSGLLDVQATVIISSSLCTQPEPRALGLAGRRTLYPTLDPDDPLDAGLWHSLVMMLTFLVLHGLVVYAVMMRYECTFAEAAPKAYFPSITLAAFMCLIPGIASASFRLLFGPGVSPLIRMASIVTGVGCVVAVLLPPGMFLRHMKAESRKHYDLLFEFPAVIRYLLPARSWGPDAKSQSWTVPFGAYGPNGLRLVTSKLGMVVALSLVFAAVPSSPTGCAAQYVFGLMLTLTQAALVIARLPLRSTFACVMSFLTSGSIALPIIVSLAHCFQKANETGVAAQALFTATHAFTIARLLAMGLSHALDLWLLRPTIWPDAALGLINARKKPVLDGETVASDAEMKNAANGVQEDGPAKRFGVQADGSFRRPPLPTGDDEELGAFLFDGEVPDPADDPEYKRLLASLRAHDQRADDEERTRAALHELTAEERSTRLAFGPPDPLPLRTLPHHNRRKQIDADRRRQLAGEPLRQMHRLRGPVPPGVLDRLQRDYDGL